MPVIYVDTNDEEVKQMLSGKTIPYSPKVIQSAMSITRILDGKISSIEFGVDDHIYHITQSYLPEKPSTKAYSYGVIAGKVENLIGHKTLKFTLYDTLFNKGVICYVEEEKRELLRNIWGKNVTVTGCIYRDIITGRPLEIHDIESIEIIPLPEPGAFFYWIAYYPKISGASAWEAYAKRPALPANIRPETLVLHQITDRADGGYFGAASKQIDLSFWVHAQPMRDFLAVHYPSILKSDPTAYPPCLRPLWVNCPLINHQKDTMR